MGGILEALASCTGSAERRASSPGSVAAAATATTVQVATTNNTIHLELPSESPDDGLESRRWSDLLKMISCPKCHHQFLHNIRAHHVGVNIQDCPSVRGIRVGGVPPMHQNQHHFHHHTNQSVVSATNHHVSFSNRFNRAVNSSGGRVEAVQPLSSPSVVRQIAAATGPHHRHTNTSSSSILKMRNRDTDSAPVVGHVPSATSHLSTKDKFSKFSALPAIQTTKRPPLLRQRTYDVLEPVYVKGPPKGKDTIKLPEIRQVTSTRKVSETKKRSTLTNSNVTGNTSVTTSRHQSPEKKRNAPKSTVTGGGDSTKLQTTTSKQTRTRPQNFRPEQISKDVLPESPTAFWFPI